MMKRTKVIIVIILVFLFGPLLAKTGIDTVNEIRLNKSLLVYEIPADLCVPILHVSAEDFFTRYCDYYDTLGDFRVYSKIDREGNLILRMTEEQRKGVIEYEHDGWDETGSIGVDDLSEIEGIEVAPDLTSVTVSCYKDNAIDQYFTARLGSWGIPAIQLLSGAEPEEIKLDIILKDAVTGEVVHTRSWPNLAYTMDQDTFDFSERPKE